MTALTENNCFSGPPIPHSPLGNNPRYTEPARQPPCSRTFLRFANVQSNWKELAKNAHFRPGELAALCGVSLRTLQRYFKSKDLRLSSWLQTIRLEHSYQLLLSGQTPKEVAYEVGYSQTSNFSRDFKAFYGVPPGSLHLVSFQDPSPSLSFNELASFS